MAEHSTLSRPNPAGLVLRDQIQDAPAAFPDSSVAPPQNGEQASRRRVRLWELDSELHCSIIGTCLSLAELRAFARKISLRLDERPTDHGLHSAVVYAVGCDEKVAKLLHKALDRKFGATLRRYGRVLTSVGVADLWREDLARGEIPGAYWAVMTHSCADQDLVSDAFAEIHMLSHLVGASNRADICRIRELERENAALHNRIARLRRQAAEKIADLARENEQLKSRMAAIVRPEPPPDEIATAAGLVARIDGLIRELALEARRRERAEHIVADQAAMLERLKSAAADSRKEAEEFRTLCAHLERRLEASISEFEAADGHVERRAERLTMRRLLFVGGKPHKMPHVRRLVATEGAEFLSHDGGVEESAESLASRIVAADAVLFPVDCVSHEAALQVKRLCQRLDKPFLPLRTFSLAAISQGLDHLSEEFAGDRRRLQSA